MNTNMSNRSSAQRPTSARRKKNQTSPFALVILVTLILIGIVGLILYFSGYRYIHAEGVKFSGFVKNGQPVSGTVRHADGISGKLEKEENSAMGKITYNTGDIYEGEIKGILREGTGKITYKIDGSVYSGDFLADTLTGHAEYTSADGTMYVGDVVDGKKHGKGKYTYPDGSYYYGDWENNKRNGVGEEHFADGSYYYGAYVDDKRTGTSDVTVTLENGMMYVGKNKYVFANGDEYVGDFLNDRRTGNGIYVWASGERYTGAFQNDLMHGTGTYDFGNGRPPYTGTFVNGQIAETGAALPTDPAESTAS